MTFGRRFINLTEPRIPGDPRSRWVGLEESDDAGDGIRRAIQWLLGRPAGRDARIGGILYLPPRRYRIGRFEMGRNPDTDFEGIHEDLAIPPEITLWFAPGAFLDVAFDNTTVNIQGSILANELMIFATAETQRNDNPSMPGWNQPRPVQGRVYLTSLQIPEVFPEWWGARTQPLDMRRSGTTGSIAQALIDTAALQACFNAAHNYRRWSPERNIFDVLRPTIPVRLMATYQLAAPLFLGVLPGERNAKNPEGFILRGCASPGGLGANQSTFLWSNEFDFPADVYPRVGRTELFRAMLVSRGCFGSVLEDVAWNASTGAGSRRARRCVLLDTEPIIVSKGGSTAANHWQAQMTVFRRCSFVNASEALVQVGPPLPPEGVEGVWRRHPSVLLLDPLEILSGAHDLSNTTFEQCHFSMGGVPFGATVQDGDPRLEADGVVLRAKESFAISFRDCWFSGPARAAIRAYGGFFLVDGCTFHTLRICQGSRPQDRVRVFGSAQVEVGNGADIFLSMPPSEVSSSNAGDGKGVPLETAGFTAIHVESQSFTFLDMHDHQNPAGVNRPVTLFNVRHSSVVQSRGGPGKSLEFEPVARGGPPAVNWQGNGRSVPLTLNNCLLTTYRGQEGYRVMIGPNTAPASVLSVGTRDEVGRIDLFGRPTGFVVDGVVRQLELTVQIIGGRP